jgi:hypothetical protein
MVSGADKSAKCNYRAIFSLKAGTKPAKLVIDGEALDISALEPSEIGQVVFGNE